jgi:hypothetical protein
MGRASTGLQDCVSDFYEQASGSSYSNSLLKNLYPLRSEYNTEINLKARLCVNIVIFSKVLYPQIQVWFGNAVQRRAKHMGVDKNTIYVHIVSIIITK